MKRLSHTTKPSSMDAVPSRPGRPSAEEAIEHVLGLVISEEKALLGLASDLGARAQAAWAQFICHQIVPDAEGRLRRLRGEDTLTPDHRAGSVSGRTLQSLDDVVSRALPEVWSLRLADFFSLFDRVLVHYAVLHSLALSTDDEVLAGIAWNHLKQVKGSVEHGMLLIPAAIIGDFGRDPRMLNRATEEICRIWERLTPGRRASRAPIGLAWSRLSGFG